ncbi:hypothetical protein [Frigoribacterium sp. PvP032]|uniref:hypothetical protein n=1 Tax=Frigoribacterium sp. PvP032 TaxID=2806589 RepID=UPI001AE71C2A|nr:hypothetical protein [Frigoribacterium sp. PvP032]MBP1190435.1 hypothetical protein [Frigoribacterium sp. PvP032]
MPDARRKRGQRASTRRRLAVLGIAAFLLVDVGLIAVAVTREPAGLAADREPSALQPSSPAEESTAPVAPTPSATPTSAAAVQPTRLLSAVDGDTAWRGEVGTCTPGTDTAELSLETTTTGGADWSSTSVATNVGLAGIDRLQAADAATVFVVGPAGATCAPAFAQTFSGGAEFGDYPDRLAAAWYVTRTDTDTVHSPSGDHAAPCPVIDLAVVSDTRAGVLCGDGTLHRTVDGATTWDAGAFVEGALAVTADAGEYLVASGGSVGCDGVAVASVGDTSTEPARVGCAPTTAGAPGSVAISAGAGSLWLWAADAVLVSADGGRTW